LAGSVIGLFIRGQMSIMPAHRENACICRMRAEAGQSRHSTQAFRSQQ
jgi:hypothetical protein